MKTITTVRGTKAPATSGETAKAKSEGATALGCHVSATNMIHLGVIQDLMETSTGQDQIRMYHEDWQV